MVFVSLSIEIFIAVIVALLIAAAGVFFILKESKKKKLYLTQVVYKLMQEKFEDVNHDEKICGEGGGCLEQSAFTGAALL